MCYDIAQSKSVVEKPIQYATKHKHENNDSYKAHRSTSHTFTFKNMIIFPNPNITNCTFIHAETNQVLLS